MAELVAAAAGSAATASAAARSDRLRQAVHGEGRELAGDVRRGAVGARDLRLAADELLEMRLAFHTDVLVDRHGSDASAATRCRSLACRRRARGRARSASRAYRAKTARAASGRGSSSCQARARRTR